MKYLILCALALVLTACGTQRAQVAADAKAGVDAAHQVLQQALAVPDVQASVQFAISQAMVVLDGIGARLPAVADMNPSDWPSPTITPQEILDNPKAYSQSAPPAPAPGGTPWGMVASAGLAALWLVGRVAPGVPVLGPGVGALADGAWSLLSHRDQKATDQSLAITAGIAANAQPMAAVLRSIPVEAMPTPLQKVFTPEVITALNHIAGLPAPSPKV